MKKTFVLVYSPLFKNQAAEYSMQMFEKHLTEMGHNCIHLDNSDKLMASVKGNKFVTFVMFNGTMTFDDSYIASFEMENHLFINILLDNPMHYESIFSSQIKNKIFFCVDEPHVTDVRRRYKEATYFMPLGGDTQPGSYQIADLPGFDRRDIDVLACFSYSNPEGVYHKIRNMFPANIEKLTQRILSYQLYNESISYDAAFYVALSDLAGHADADNFQDLKSYLFPHVDSIVRYEHRYQCMRTLLDAGIQIHCCGPGWDTSDLVKYDNFSYHGKTSYIDTFPLVIRSKIFLNAMPNFHYGTHDRIFTAMLNGAVSLTDATPYLTERFNHMDTLAYYTFRDLNKLPQTAAEILSNKDLYESITSKAYGIARANHTWAHRADDVVLAANLFEAADFNMDEFDRLFSAQYTFK